MRELRFFSDDLEKRYGRKLHRIALDLALGCPNRPDRYGPGCVFCAENGARARHLTRNLDLAAQVERGREYLRERYQATEPYIAYFQSFTSTYAPAERLRELYECALAQADFKVVIVGTRPDALEPEVLAYLEELSHRFELWVELGVQSAHDPTLRLIRRGHDFAAVRRACDELAKRKISTALHLILGLPGEDEATMLASATRIAALPFRAVKLHQLQVLKNTELARGWNLPQSPLRTVPLDEYSYARLAAKFLRLLPEGTLVMRLNADADPEQLIAPKWWLKKGQFLEFFRTFFASCDDDGMIEAPTGDGSRTLYHPQFHQLFHSRAGAKSEAEAKFILPSKLHARLAGKSPLRLLDVGFGLGVNAFAAACCALDADRALEITSLELDERPLRSALRLPGCDALHREMLEEVLRNNCWRRDNVTLLVLWGDARKSLARLDRSILFDLIYQDAFSPEVNPELWSYDFVRLQAAHLAPDGLLVSYCAAHHWRGALLRSGLEVGDTPPFGRRRGGSAAGHSGQLIESEISPKERAIILRSTAGAPLRDPTLDATGAEILARHKKLVARLRSLQIPKWAVFREQ